MPKTIRLSFFFFFATPHGLHDFDLSFLTRDQAPAPCSVIMESEPLDCEGIPILSYWRHQGVIDYFFWVLNIMFKNTVLCKRILNPRSCLTFKEIKIDIKLFL